MTKLWKELTHLFRRKQCVREAVWERGVLRCPCGEILALRYAVDGCVRLYVYPEYKKFHQEIVAGQIGLPDGDVIGTLCFDDISSFLRSIPPSEPAEPDETDEETIDEEDTSFGKSLSESQA